MALRKAQLGTDYEPLRGALPGSFNLVPVDIDGVMERDGRFLFLENKQPGEPTSTGQLRMLCALARQPRMTVLLVILDGSKHETGAASFVPTHYVKLTGNEWKTWEKDINDQLHIPESAKKPTDIHRFRGLFKAWFTGE